MNSTLSSENQAVIKSAYLLISVLWACFLFTVVILTVLPQTGIIHGSQKSEQSLPQLNEIFSGLAVFLVICGFLAKKVALKTRKPLEQSSSLTSAIKSFHLAHLISFVIFESIALLGFINYIISSDATSAAIFGGISIVCMLIAWPKMNDLKKLV